MLARDDQIDHMGGMYSHEIQNNQALAVGVSIMDDVRTYLEPVRVHADVHRRCCGHHRATDH